MKINRVFGVMFVVLLIMSMVGAVSAAVTDNQPLTYSPSIVTSTATVQYGATHSYNIVLPSKVEFTSTESELNADVIASDVILNEGASLSITVRSEHSWKMYQHLNGQIEDSMIPYSVSFYVNNNHQTGEVSFNGSDFAESTSSEDTIILIAPTGTTEITTTMTFKFEAVPHVGEFFDTLTFTINPNYNPNSNQ